MKRINFSDMIVDDWAGGEVKDTASVAPASAGVEAVERSCSSSSSLGTIAGRVVVVDDVVVDVIVGRQQPMEKICCSTQLVCFISSGWCRPQISLTSKCEVTVSVFCQKFCCS